ncbi:hypothetical protein GCM10010260_75730 [Streptomyces filipinensis]|uniref:DUF4097 domain-containing protein n=1 Tax=Streptomyces filipinensis TaxID=66887 RepID=A0A918IIS7_9ACTN|nr:DUF4097 family beta strand repeat-containing protein [Streptomyces filipinensis]GGV24174.1 hypothetical protein GCM10010260_75730 [Streptomyces filipinensis]
MTRASRRSVGIALTALSTAVVLAGCNPTTALHRTSYSQTSQLSVQPGMALKVDTPGIGVTLSAGDDSHVRVSATGDYSDARPQLSTSKSGDTAVVNAGCSGSCDLQLHITLPASMSAHVQSGNSEIVAEGLAGSLDLRTGDGAITVKHPTGPLSLHSGNGQITLSDAASQRAGLSTTDGAVDAAFTTAPANVNIATKDGAVDLAVPSGAGYSVLAHSTGSTPEVDVPNSRGASHALTVSTASGGVHIH